MSSQVASLDEVRSFICRCMVKVGVIPEHATALADLLVAADYRGHYSHGLNRLQMYIRDIQEGKNEKLGNPEIVKETVATAFVDGNNILGPPVGKFCIDLAISKAKQCGIGMVVAKQSNHFGIAGWYSIRAMEQGLIGLAFTNTSPVVVPTRAKAGAVGTNPITLAAPGKNGDSFVLDMATSAVALGKVEVANVKQEPIPLGWAVNGQGKETTVASEMLDDGGLMPLGGGELTSGYKGYGLGVAVEILCGILAGSKFGPFVRPWKSSSEVADLGQCFIAIDPKAFADGFEDRLQTLMDYYRSMEPSDPEKPVLVAGDPERKHMKDCDSLGGIKYHPNMLAWMDQIAADLGVEKMKLLS